MSIHAVNTISTGIHDFLQVNEPRFIHHKMSMNERRLIHYETVINEQRFIYKAYVIIEAFVICSGCIAP